MSQTVERQGKPASPGLAAGPIHHIAALSISRRTGVNTSGERRDFEAAVRAAIKAVRALASRIGGEAADMLEFQAAMLEDDALIAPALGRISDGQDAASAWSETVAAEIENYASAEDEYFRARVADLKDLRDEVLRHLSGLADAPTPEGAVLAADDVTPTRFLSVDWSRGGALALFSGSPSSHVAMLARSRGVPMIVGLGAIDLKGHTSAIVDGDAGVIVLSPREKDWSAFHAAVTRNADRTADEAEAARQPATTADGALVSVMINVAEPGELATVDPVISDGIGLVRTEFLFNGTVADEETQYQAYSQIVRWAGSRPVVLRTVDAGGDKPVPGLTRDGESNPFLGVRGIRLSLARPDVFRIQLRAMARAAAVGNVRVMLPMVTVPEEIDRAAALLDEVVVDLRKQRVPCARPPLGIMVEVPAVAIVPELFARADFFSIGSNDLTQYVTASARDIAEVAELNDPGHPAVLALIRRVVEAGANLGKDVSLCGDMGGDINHIPALIAAGLRSVSVAPRLVGRAKRAIAATRARAP